MRTIALTLATAALLFLGRPAQAAAIEDAPNAGATYQQVVREAREMLAPVAQQRHVRIHLDVQGSSAVAGDLSNRTRDKVLNLLANAIAVAPANSELTVRFDPTSYKVCVKVANRAEALSTSRDVVDPSGNAFHIDTVAGLGTELNTSLADLPLAAAVTTP